VYGTGKYDKNKEINYKKKKKKKRIITTANKKNVALL
jgi:hypothetical protein